MEEKKQLNYISIIITAYNSEKYIKECVTSILNQGFKQIEIIIINDGSTDQTESICLELKNKDSRIKYVKVENGGVSKARNIGIRYATGKYITFIDSDDYVLQNFFSDAAKVLQNKNLLLLKYNHYELKGENFIRQKDVYIQNFSIDELAACIISGYTNRFYIGPTMARVVWATFFDLELIRKNNIYFDESLYIGEDALFCLSYLYLINDKNKINFVNKSYYVYRIREDSACRKYKGDFHEQCLKQQNSLQNIVETQYGNKIPLVIEQADRKFLWQCLRLSGDNICKKISENKGKTNELYAEILEWYSKFEEYIFKSPCINISKGFKFYFKINRIFSIKIQVILMCIELYVKNILLRK